LDDVVRGLKASGDFEALRGGLLIEKAANLVREAQPA
jgi:hypothetical protein